MFDKIKQLAQLKQLRDSVAKEKAEVEKQGVKVVVNGKMEVESIQLNTELQKAEQEKLLVECINEAVKKVQMIVAQKLSQFKDLGF